MAGKKGTDQFSKSIRINAIIKLITENEIGTQEELKSRLLDLGFDVTQATLSRDIRSLMLTKTNNGTRSVYRMPLGTHDKSLTKQFETMAQNVLVDISQAENQVVVHTQAGMANALAALIDQLKLGNIMGTLAGDDTILVIAKDKTAAAEFCKLLDKIK